MRPVPSAFTGELKTYLGEIVDTLNRVPTFSFFSGTTPESVITGVAGNFAINPYSANTATMIFYKGGSPITPSKVSWYRLSLSSVS
jgi:hypothetical protein